MATLEYAWIHSGMTRRGVIPVLNMQLRSPFISAFVAVLILCIGASTGKDDGKAGVEGWFSAGLAF